MRFIKTESLQHGAAALLDRLKQELNDGKKVLWLLSGGSVVAAEASILNSLYKANMTDGLTVMLMDERYGSPGHKDSNWYQLEQAGCDFASLQAVPVLTEPLGALEDTAVRYGERVRIACENTDVILGLFGLGPDGHTAGILPGSPAAEDTDDLVVSYKTPEHERITLTRNALIRVDVGFVLAYGDAKLNALNDLRDSRKDFREMPSRLLAELPEVYVYNDQIGEPQ